MMQNASVTGSRVTNVLRDIGEEMEGWGVGVVENMLYLLTPVLNMKGVSPP